jgi:cytochrome P450
MMIYIAVALVAIPTVLYVLYKLHELASWKKFKYAKIPRITPIESIKALAGGPTKYHLELAQKLNFGPYLSYFGFTPRLVIADPENARKVMLATKSFFKPHVKERFGSHAVAVVGEDPISSVNGDAWHKQRTLLTPSFINPRVYSETFNRQTLRCIELMHEKQQQGYVEVTRFMQAVTLDIIGEAILGFDFERINSINEGRVGKGDKYSAAIHYMMTKSFNVTKMVLGEPYMKTPLIHQEFWATINEFNGFIAQMTKAARERVARGEDAASILDLIVQSIDNGGEMTDETLRSNAVIFFFAGHETTTSAMSYCLYYLSSI